MRRRLYRLLAVLCWTAVLVVMSGPEGRAEDSERLRGYFGVRFGEAPWGKVNDAAGITLGANVTRYLGAELAVDSFDLNVEPPGLGDVAELGTISLVPQVRLRYPLLRDRLVPYVIAGAGVAFSQVNDVKQAGWTLQIDGGIQTTPIGTVGAGLDYFVADNISLGVEVRYQVSGQQTVTIQGQEPFNVNLDSAFAQVQLRVFYPELHPPASFVESGEPRPNRFYIGLRVGGAIPTQSQPFSGIESMPEPPAYFNTVNQMFGVALGYHFNRYFALDLAGDGYELRLALPGDRGALGEYAVTALTLQPRLRYPLLNGRLEPYVLGGVGAGFAEFNDANPGAAGISVKAKNFAVVGTVGAGIDYFITSNVALGFETKYLIARGFTAQINNGPILTGNLDSVLFSLGIRLFLF